ncbi:MAG: hypothetical protein WKG07_43760 [Hymenobacter sp.]
MQQTADRPSRFPLVFEVLIWVVYVGLYKYSVYLEQVPTPPAGRPNFPFPYLIPYALLASAYVVPYYRWLVPLLLRRRWHLLLLGLVLPYFWLAGLLNFELVNSLFRGLAKLGMSGLRNVPFFGTWGLLSPTLSPLAAWPSCG